MTEEKNTINVNGTEHNVADLTKEQQYMVVQVKDLDAKANNLKFQLDQITVAKESFSNALIKSIEEGSNETKDGDNT